MGGINLGRQQKRKDDTRQKSTRVHTRGYVGNGIDIIQAIFHAKLPPLRETREYISNASQTIPHTYRKSERCTFSA